MINFKKLNINRLSVKYLNFGLKKKTGKNFTGNRTVKSKGYGKSKRKYRIIDFYRNNYSVKAIVLRIEYDPNRSSNIALICYKNGFLSYIISPNNLKENDIIDPNLNNVGVVKKLKNFKFGTFIHCVESNLDYGFKIARAAGCYCIVLNQHLNNKVILRFPSGEEKLINNNNKGILGIVSNINLKYKKLKKAGNNI
jgi:large subunit ribosomal protein L2